MDGYKALEIVEAARKRLVKEGLLPEIHKALLQNISEYGNPFQEPAEKRTDVYPSSYKKKEAEENSKRFPRPTQFYPIRKKGLSMMPGNLKG
jgi:heterodisulfide reductase subunit C